MVQYCKVQIDVISIVHPKRKHNFNHSPINVSILFSQVFLGRKKDKTGDKSGMLYAIKTMKKTELVKKNMIDQGED